MCWLWNAIVIVNCVWFASWFWLRFGVIGGSIWCFVEVGDLLAGVCSIDRLGFGID